MERRKVIDRKNGGFFRRFNVTSGKLHRVYRYLINYVYPNICPCCEKIIDHDEDFCDECKNEIVIYNGGFCVENADYFVSYCMYEGKVCDAIRNFKHEPRGNSYYAFAFGIVQALYSRELAKSIDLVTYIPMTKEAFRNRGYNQTEMIAEEIHYLLDIPCEAVLKKVKGTKSQKSIKTQAERKKNVSGIFAMQEKAEVAGKCVLLVDDLCTTGSTLSEAARVLREAGAGTIIAATFAKTNNKENSINT